MERLKIGTKTLDIPIVQGGMGVGISLGELAGSVARLGAVGTISSVAIGYKEEDYYTNNLEANKRALQREVDKAKEISKGKGLIAINIMEAITDYEKLASFAGDTGADMLVVGAGLPLSLPKLVEGKDILIGPIVSSLRAFKIIARTWQKKYKKKPDFLVVEGPLAGGHLGYKIEDLKKASLGDIIGQIRAYLDQEGLDIPLIGGGGIRDSSDVRGVLDQGADGVQVGTRFITTIEAGGSKSLKDLHKSAKEEDLEIVYSPVGLPARAIHTRILDTIKNKRIPSKRCINCLKPCDPAATPYCIHDALINGLEGNLDRGLVFAGARPQKEEKILSVDKLIDELTKEIR